MDQLRSSLARFLGNGWEAEWVGIATEAGVRDCFQQSKKLFIFLKFFKYGYFNVVEWK